MTLPFGCDILYLVGAIIMGFAPGVVTLCVGRLLVGVAVGTSSVNIPLYLSELAPARWGLSRRPCVSLIEYPYALATSVVTMV
jgi:MFS family permease